MTRKSLDGLLQEVGNPIHFLRNSQAGAFAFPIVPAEFTNWRNEQRGWRETVSISDQSYHMGNMLLTGSGALPLLNSLGVNSFSNFEPGKAKQFVVCNYDGRVIGDLILFYVGVEQLLLVGRAPTMNWVQFHASQGKYDVEVRRQDRAALQTSGQPLERDYYRYQIQGPNAPELFAKLGGEPMPAIKFFNLGKVKIGAREANALRHSMSGVPGLEIWGPYEEAQEVLGAIVEAGKEFGLRQIGSRAYGTGAVESGWIPAPVPAVYTGEAMKSYREWLPALGYETFNSVGGSFASDNIEDYYVTPYELGYGGFVKFDHDFIGREALEKIAGQPHRRKMTFVWNSEDVARVMASGLDDQEQLPFKAIDLPVPNYAASPYDKVMMGDRLVGFSMFAGYSYNERAVMSLGIVEPDIQVDDVLTLVWGEENGGTKKPTVEPHRQTEIRVRVANVPYTRDARENYGGGWRLRQS